MSDFEPVASINEIEPGGRKEVLVDETPVLIVRVGDQFYAIEDVCTHDGQALADGPVQGSEIVCPRHGARFDLATGKALCMPATQPIRTFQVEVRDGQVFVKPDGPKADLKDPE